jgi:hypothetical protein
VRQLAIADAAAAVLRAVQDGFAAARIALPLRQYASFGREVDDCEQAVVMVGEMYLGEAGQPQITWISRDMQPDRVVTMSVAILRCAPDVDESGSPPSGADLNAYGTAAMTDAAVLWDAVNTPFVAGTLVPLCRQGVIGPLTPIGPLGGLGGVALSLALAL